MIEKRSVRWHGYALLPPTYPEAELKSQSQNPCGLRADKLQESLTIMRHFGLDLSLLQEAWRLLTNDNDLWDHYLVVEHGLPVKRYRRGSLGLAIILNGRCCAPFERAGYHKDAFWRPRHDSPSHVPRRPGAEKLLFYVVNPYAPYDASTSKPRRLMSVTTMTLVTVFVLALRERS